jgi:putative MATE family efflux protein
MLLIMFFYFFVGFTDVFVAGLISADVQASVGFVNQIYYLIILIANALAVGTLAMVSRAAGSNRLERALEIARQSLIFSVLVALTLTGAGLMFYRDIIALAGFPEKIRTIAEDFLKIFTFSLAPYYILIISNSIFRASGEVKKPLFTMFAVSLINIIGDFVLVFGISPFPKMGYSGIALSTAVSVTAGMLINLWFLSRGLWKPFYKGAWSVVGETVYKIMKIGWPAALLQIAWNAGTIVLYNILGRMENNIVALAAITNGLRIEAVIYLPAFALNMAASVLVGQNLGAGNADRAESVGWKITQAGVMLISAMALVIFIRAEDFASLLAKSPDVLEETTRYLRINMASEPFMAMSSILGGGLQGSGDTRGAMWAIVIPMWFIRLPLAYLFAVILDYGVVSVWIAMVLSMICQGLFMAVRFQKGHWKTLKVE